MSDSKLFWLILVIVLIIGVYIGTKTDELFFTSTNYSAEKKFNDVLEYADQYYYEEVEKEELVENAINGMLDKLDPHSVYIPSSEQLSINEELKGKFDGIGIEFQIINDSITVVTAISGGPSESVGILPGDRIIEIEGKSSIGFKNSDVLTKLRGEKGTEVNLKIYRPFINSTLNFSLVRDQIPLYTVEAALMINDSIAYISLSKFVETSIYEIKEALKQLSQMGMKSLILDLRNNPGGYLDQAIQIADLFLDNNKLIVFTRGRKSEFDLDLKAEKTYPYENLPLALLVNSGSASASEIVSGAIQDWDRGFIVGETTFGKGLVQQPFNLPDNSALRITISKYYTPSGREIQRDFTNRENYYAVTPDQDNKENIKVIELSKQDSLEQIFTTNGGRKLKSNGGITPDIIVKNEELTYYSILLRSKDLFYRFVRKYLDKNSDKIILKYNNNFNKFSEEFSFTNTDIDSFTKFAEDNNVSFDKEEFEKDKEYIKLRLKAHVAKNFWNNDGWYRIILKMDNQFNKTKNLLEQNYKININ